MTGGPKSCLGARTRRQKTDDNKVAKFHFCQGLNVPMLKFWYFILILVSGSRLVADEAPSFVIDGERFLARQQNVYNMGVVAEEMSESQILDAIAQHRYELSNDYFMEFEKYSYWLMPVENNNPGKQKVFLRFIMKMPVTKAWWVRGNELVAFERSEAIDDTFSSELPPGRSLVIGMRLSGGNVKGRAAILSLHDPATMAAQMRLDQHLMGGILGIVAIMILYNLGMFMTFRRIYFIYYSIYSAAMMYIFLVFYGYLVWDLRFLGLGFSGAGVGLLLFCNSALSLDTTRPKLYRISKLLLAYCSVFWLYVWFVPSWNPIALSIPPTMIFCIYVSVIRARDGYRPGMYLVVGWTVLLAAALSAAINLAFIGNGTFAGMNLYGFALEICFFSFAIGQKVRLAEQQALRESEHAFNQLKKVFYSHQIAQIKSGVELEKTMPTGKGKAVVINFDIIESSKIRQPSAKSFIENSIKACVSLISENYDPEHLKANGYRIKEVGDGFLCSVGFPFKVPGNMTSAECAVSLAFRFMRVFQMHVDLLQNHSSVYCSIGIAADWLEGYFPQVGTREYDVHGRAVILATRYESLRRQLFPQGVPGHILTIQEKVFEGLPAVMQQDFVEVDLHDAHLVVRDDLGARKLYYRVVDIATLELMTKAAG